MAELHRQFGASRCFHHRRYPERAACELILEVLGSWRHSVAARFATPPDAAHLNATCGASVSLGLLHGRQMLIEFGLLAKRNAA